jgi:rRNA maturation protein Nop10
MTTEEYPMWVCSPCGQKYGKKECGVATWHLDECGICGEREAVAEPRDFGHLKDGWQIHGEKHEQV